MTWGSSKDTFAASLCIRPTATLRRSMTEPARTPKPSRPPSSNCFGGTTGDFTGKRTAGLRGLGPIGGAPMAVGGVLINLCSTTTTPISIIYLTIYWTFSIWDPHVTQISYSGNPAGEIRSGVFVVVLALTCARASRQQSNRPSTCGGAPRLLSRRRRPPWRRYLGRRVWAGRAVISSASGAASRRLSVLLFLLPFRSEARPSIPPHPLIAPRTETSVLALVCFFSF
ncbi:hypothetical protein B296_00008834 [Ensete ventricosum]|uniref:Uncharacterized protein n=1 Tax=Ensete ventricosum TaxID=4639 RepID=A0A426Z0E2_ENSVE|nr:hypothetical protein B296_00008834 [Ensete ventricosum]